MFGRLIHLFSKKKETPDITPHHSCCCLTKRIISKNDPVPLKSVNIDVRIEGFIADVRSTLCYKNVEKNPIEARYEYPMDDQSAVYYFEAQIEDRIIIAECQEKKQAKETYDDAVNEGFGAVLMQEDDFSSDIFSCLVGNLPPDAEAVIKFGYVTELSLQPDGTLSFFLPTLLNPRYNPSEQSGGSQSPQDVNYVPKGGEQPYKFEIRATIVNPGKIVDIKSPKDKLDVKFNQDKTEAQVTLAKPFVADHDLTLDVSFEELYKPHIIIEKGDDAKDGILKKDVVMLNFFPELKDADYTNKHEFIFVVDRSGSMSGSRMKGAKETLLLFLKSLPPGCYFNVVGFGSDFEVLFQEGSREYCEETLKVACEHQQMMEANLGGTEILEPLKHIYGKPPMATHCREILLLTDGEVMNTQAVIDLVKENANSTRVFSFGIGEGASTTLIKGVARAGRGRAEFTKETERLQPLVVKTLKAAMQLAVTDLHLDWQLRERSCELIQMPKEMPPVFAGERLIIYAMTSKDKAMLDGRVQLKGKIGEHSLEFEIDVDASKNISSSEGTFPIHRLAAKAQIKQLQDAGKDKNKMSIVLLSTAANIISCHTSMVGVDKNRKQKVVGGMMRRSVPMMSDTTLYCAAPTRSLSRGLKKKSAGFGIARSSGSSAQAYRCSSQITRECMAPSGLDYFESLDGAPRTKGPMKEPNYMDLVALQTFSGQWMLNAEVAGVMNTTLDALQSVDPIKNLDVWATVLAITYLEVKFANERDEWEMVETKARQWLSLQDREGLSIDDLLQKAKAVIGIK